MCLYVCLSVCLFVIYQRFNQENGFFGIVPIAKWLKILWNVNSEYGLIGGFVYHYSLVVLSY